MSRSITFEIVWTDGFQDPNVMGETRFEPNQIVIKKGMSNKETVKTYLHEVAHAYSDVYKMNLTETQVLNFEKGLYYLLKSGNILKE